MIKMIMHGCNGHMGRVIADLVRDDDQIDIVAGIDLAASTDGSFPVYANAMDCKEEADVVIDFSNAKAVDALLEFCVHRELPVVVCTTGLDEAQQDKLRKCADHVAVLRSANMSLGINMLLNLLKNAVQVLAPAGFDIEIVEKHHHHKVDAPSGTALALADSINESMGNLYTYKYDRSQERKARDPQEIGISSVRGGSIVGDHEVIFAGTDEVIEFKHTAYSKAVFAKGAIQAAKFLAGKHPGMYDMSDVIQAQS